MTQRVKHIEVYYVDRENGWCASGFGHDDVILPDPSVYAYLKADCISEAKYMFNDDYPVKVFGRNGELQRVLEPPFVEFFHPTQ